MQCTAKVAVNWTLTHDWHNILRLLVPEAAAIQRPPFRPCEPVPPIYRQQKPGKVWNRRSLHVVHVMLACKATWGYHYSGTQMYRQNVRCALLHVRTNMHGHIALTEPG
jgi:hypothetical protein